MGKVLPFNRTRKDKMVVVSEETEPRTLEEELAHMLKEGFTEEEIADIRAELEADDDETS